jgi:ATP-dependent protease Clp ATPase subunit
MFDLPSMEDVIEVVMYKDVVLQKKTPLIIYKNKVKKTGS